MGQEDPSPKRAAPAKRNNTRLLGFSAEETAPDVFATKAAPVAAPQPRYPIGWLVVLEGPGQGMSFTVMAGLTTIGRAETQTISLDFGDDSISREQHMAIAYDEDENTTFVGHGGKRNIVRLNGKPLLTTEELADGDHIKIGKTLLYYIALCGSEFAWKDVMGDGQSNG
ncbi:MAG: FHA domain-containing protein [Pseudomonadota bacterium]